MRILIVLLATAALFGDEVSKVQTEWSGMLVDAGCPDRSLANLLSPPTQVLAPTVESKPPRGLAVSPQVLKAERSNAVLPDTPDHASRYESASCALTSATTHFGLVLASGELLNLSEGGNTLAFEAFQNTPAGREILNGKVGGLKPRGVVHGLRSGDRLYATQVRITAPNAR